MRWDTHSLTGILRTQAKVAKGEELDEQQEEKLDRLDEVIEEMDALMSK